MAAKPGFFDYVAAAFNARPFGMFVAPNWVGLAAFGLLGMTNPGFWVLGAGLELGYLLTLATNARFQRRSSAQAADGRAHGLEPAHRQGCSAGSTRSDVRTYDALAQRCRSILDLQMQNAADAAGRARAAGRQPGPALVDVPAAAAGAAHHRPVLGTGRERRGPAAEDGRARASAARRPALSEELPRSLSGQLEILASASSSGLTATGSSRSSTRSSNGSSSRWS